MCITCSACEFLLFLFLYVITGKGLRAYNFAPTKELIKFVDVRFDG